MSYTIGIDEVGRGCLAGAVYLSGVKLSENFPLYTFSHQYDELYNNQISEFKLVRDSKKLPAKTREKISDLIIRSKLQSCTLTASNDLIDRFGIGVCLSHMVGIIITILADDAKTNVIIDGKIKLLAEFNSELLELLFAENEKYSTQDLLVSPTLFVNTQKLSLIRENKADDKYLSIALASNLAKVARDKKMTVLGNQYPEYDWQTNKGYGTLKHRRAIKNNPNNPYLRKTFLGRILK
jgi:ribonuclease HII